MKIKAGIVGATGYAGAELVRLLTAHPEAEISAISSVSFEGDKLSDVYPSYTFLNDMVCENQDAVVEKSDVIFAALPHGLSQELAAKCIDAGKALWTSALTSALKAKKNTPNGTAELFSIKNFTNRQFTDFLNFSEIKIKGKKACCKSGLLHNLFTARNCSCNCKRTCQHKGHHLRLQKRRYGCRQKAKSGQPLSRTQRGIPRL